MTESPSLPGECSHLRQQQPEYIIQMQVAYIKRGQGLKENRILTEQVGDFWNNSTLSISLVLSFP